MNASQLLTEALERGKLRREMRSYYDYLASHPELENDPLWDAIEALEEVVANLAYFVVLVDEDREQTKALIECLMESASKNHDKAVRALVDRARLASSGEQV